MQERYTVDSKPTIFRRIVTLVAIIAAFGVNIWANVNPPNDLTIGQISNHETLRLNLAQGPNSKY